MMRVFVLIMILVLAALSAGSGECEGFYHAFEWGPDGSYADLGTLPGGTDSWAYANNYSGQVAGWSTNSADERHAVRWETDGSVVDLGTGIAYAINDLGQVVGTSNGRAVFWDADGTLQDIGLGVAEGINDQGQVAGTIYVPVGGGLSESHAFVWSTLTGLQDLGKLPGTIGSVAHGINNSGWVSGTSLVNEGWSQAFVWSLDSGWTILGDGGARAINDAGEVAGNSLFGQAFFWSGDEGRVDVSNLTASGLGASGQLIGYSYDTDYNPHATLWQNGSPARDLGVPTGYLWSEAYGVNDQGQIVGAAMCIPEPSSAVAIILGFAGLAARRRGQLLID